MDSRRSATLYGFPMKHLTLAAVRYTNTRELAEPRTNVYL